MEILLLTITSKFIRHWSRNKKFYERLFFLDFHIKNWMKYLVTITVCKLWGGLCIIFTGQVASKADGFRLNRQKSPKARAHSGERAPKLKVKLTTQFRQPHLSALIAHSRLEFSLNHLVLDLFGCNIKDFCWWDGNKVSLLGVDSLWGGCTFIPADWGS